MNEPTAAIGAPSSPEAAYECNGRQVSAQAFYEVACDPRRSVAVEACAGSGKTWMLVSRIVRALLEGKPGQPLRPQDVLAITFTKKAAAEMRERLQLWLVQWATASEAECADALIERGMTPTQALLRAADLRSLYGRLLDGGGDVQFRTFHAWFITLISAAPFAVLEQLNLPTSPVLLEDHSRATALLWRPFFKALLQEPQAHQDYCALVSQLGRFTAHKALESLLERRLEFGLADAQGRLETSVAPFGEVWPEWAGLPHPDALLAHRTTAVQTFLAAAKTLGTGTAELVKSAVLLEQAVSAVVVMPDDDQQLQSAVQKLIETVLTKTGQPRWANKKAADHAEIRAAQALAVQWLAVRAHHQAWLHQQRMCRLGRVLLRELAALKRARSWMDMADVERAALTLLSDARLSAWVCQKLDTQVRHVLIDEFQDTNPLQWQALSAWLDGYAGAGGGHAPSVFLVGDPKQSIYRFRRAEPAVMLAAQRFVVEGLGGDLLRCDHTRRNAPGVMLAINQLMAGSAGHPAMEGFRQHTTALTAGGQAHLLPAIVRDASSASADEPEGTAALGSAAWRDSLTQRRDEPGASIRAQECEQVAQEVLRLMSQGVAAEQVMVLARKRDRLQPMAQALQAEGVMARIGEAGSLGDAPEVQDILGLVDAALSTQHDLSLARALKSPLFGAADADLVALAEVCRQAPREARPSWWQVLLAPHAHDGPADWSLHPALQRAQATLPRWQAWLLGLPPHDALSHVFTDGDVVARCVHQAPAHRQATVLRHLRALLASALSLDSGRYLSIHRWLRAVRAGEIETPTPGADGAVRLLTIHGAKGLEASAVILLDTDNPNARSSGPSVLMDWPMHRAAPERLVFIVSESRAPQDAAELLNTERSARDREELNALYVAATRARELLLFSSVTARNPAAHSWWARAAAAGLSAVAQARAGEALAADTPFNPDGPESPVAAVLRELPRALLADAFKLQAERLQNDADLAPGPPPALSKELAAPGAPAEVALGEAVSVWRGKLMHWMLERHPTEPGNHLPALREPSARWAQAQGLSAALADSLAHEALQLALQILQGPGAWAWDKEHIDWWANEVDVVCAGGQTGADSADGAYLDGTGTSTGTGTEPSKRIGRIDRLVRERNTGRWWVLDYKSSLSSQTVEQGSLQVQQYMQAMALSYPGQVVVGALLSPTGMHRVDGPRQGA